MNSIGDAPWIGGPPDPEPCHPDDDCYKCDYCGKHHFEDDTDDLLKIRGKRDYYCVKCTLEGDDGVFKPEEYEPGFGAFNWLYAQHRRNQRAKKLMDLAHHEVIKFCGQSYATKLFDVFGPNYSMVRLIVNAVADHEIDIEEKLQLLSAKIGLLENAIENHLHAIQHLKDGTDHKK